MWVVIKRLSTRSRRCIVSGEFVPKDSAIIKEDGYLYKKIYVTGESCTAQQDVW
jgi:hypothetical protein